MFDPQTANEVSVARWLRSGLEAYKAKNSRWVFGPLALRMGHRDDVAHDLLGIFETLSEDAKDRWRKAVVALVSALDVPLEPEIAVTVIDLAVLIGADEILDELPAIIAAEHSPTGLLLNRVVDAVFELSGKPSSAVACLYAASGVAGFPTASAGLVLMALCRLEPNRWIDHAKHLTPAIESLRNELEADSAVLRHYARKVAAGVTWKRLARDWPAVKAERSLQWFREALAEDDDLILLERDGEPSLADVIEHRAGVTAAAWWRVKAEGFVPSIFGGTEQGQHFGRSTWSPAPVGGDHHIISMLGPSAGSLVGDAAEAIALLSEVRQCVHGTSQMSDWQQVLDPVQRLWDQAPPRGERSRSSAGEEMGLGDADWSAKLSELPRKNVDNYSYSFITLQTPTAPQSFGEMQIDPVAPSFPSETSYETPAAT